MNPFILTALEKQQILENFKQLTSLQKHDIAYRKEVTGTGYDSTGGEWNDYKTYSCILEKVSKLNIKRYPYGDIKENDIVILFPHDTKLPNSSEYKLKYNDIYYSKTGLIAQEFIDETVLYYAMVFKL